MTRNTQLEQLVHDATGQFLDPQFVRPGDGTVRNQDGAILGPDWSPLLGGES